MLIEMTRSLSETSTQLNSGPQDLRLAIVVFVVVVVAACSFLNFLTNSP